MSPRARRRLYTLYRWNLRPLGGLTMANVRGPEIFRSFSYKELQAEARRRAQLAGYPKDQWMHLYDWNMREIDAIEPDNRPARVRRAARETVQQRTVQRKRKA